MAWVPVLGVSMTLFGTPPTMPEYPTAGVGDPLAGARIREPTLAPTAGGVTLRTLGGAGAMGRGPEVALETTLPLCGMLGFNAKDWRKLSLLL